MSNWCTTNKIYRKYISKQSVQPDPERIEGIQKMKEPNSIKELQRFLGVINNLSPHINNLAYKTSNLRKLLKKDCVWK